MVVRIRLGKPSKPAAKRARNRRFAQGVAALLKPAALMALALGIWAIGADFKFTSTFAIRSGWLSHWLVWLAVAVILEFCSIALNRYGQRQAPPKTSPTGPARRAGRAERAAAELP